MRLSELFVWKAYNKTKIWFDISLENLGKLFQNFLKVLIFDYGKNDNANKNVMWLPI